MSREPPSSIHSALFYAEDHDEQGCDQAPADQIWIQVDADNIWPDSLGPDPADDDPMVDGDDLPIECGNIVVPHSKGKKGGGKR